MTKAESEQVSEVKSTTHIPVSPERIWEMIGVFGALADWHPAIDSCELEDGGRKRRLKLVGGAEVLESLEVHDNAGRTYTYRILEAPLPIRNYCATLSVADDGKGGSRLTWAGAFEPLDGAGDVSDTVRNLYETGFDNIRKMMGM